MVHILCELDVLLSFFYWSYKGAVFGQCVFFFSSSLSLWLKKKKKKPPSIEIIIAKVCNGSESMFKKTTGTQIPHEYIHRL